ncbi:MAG: DUF4442 domain-containing protein [Anaeromyxobacter sp.]
MSTPTDRPWRRRALRLWANVYGPYLLSGVSVTEIAPRFQRIAVRMAMRPWNRNYVGTHFGGSLFAMADPWFMITPIERLGPGYLVWDKAATVRFRKPGRGTVRAVFEVPDAAVEAIRATADAEGRTEPVFAVDITDAAGEVVAQVEKVILGAKAGVTQSRRGPAPPLALSLSKGELNTRPRYGVASRSHAPPLRPRRRPPGPALPGRHGPGSPTGWSGGRWRTSWPPGWCRWPRRPAPPSRWIGCRSSRPATRRPAPMVTSRRGSTRWPRPPARGCS